MPGEVGKLIGKRIPPTLEILADSSGGGECNTLTSKIKMDTGQRYVGGGNNALPNEPTVKPGELLKQWQIDFLRNAADDFQTRNDLFELIDHVRELHETYDPTAGLCLLLDAYLSGKQPNRATDEDRTHIAAVVRLIGFINRVKSDFFCFDNNCDFVNQYEEVVQKEREVSHE